MVPTSRITYTFVEPDGIVGGIGVTRLLRCLGLVGVLAGAGLMLPPIASAAVPPSCIVVAPSHFRIEETKFFQVSTALDPTEMFQCSYTPAVPFIFFYDLRETTSGPVSDYFDQGGFGGIVTLTSDAHNPEIGLGPRGTVSGVPVTWVNEIGSEGSNGATIVIDDGHGNTLATFDVISDLPGGEIPEPSTVLLVGAALPGIWGIRRSREPGTKEERR